MVCAQPLYSGVVASPCGVRLGNVPWWSPMSGFDSHHHPLITLKCDVKPTLIVKSSEWNTMPQSTKEALAKLTKHLQSITAEEWDKIRNAQFLECGCKSTQPKDTPCSKKGEM